MRRCTILVLLGLVTALGTIHAAPVALTRGIEAYWNADYASARHELESIEPDTLPGQDRVELHKFLGLVLWAENHRDAAADQFLQLLRIEPAYRVDADEVAPPLAELFQTALDRALSESYRRGTDLYRAGHYAEARTVLQDARRIDPGSAHVRVLLELIEMRTAGSAKL